MRSDRQTLSGFTLVEMIVVIVITSIIGALAAMFLRAPVQQYMEVGRRADLTEIADLALRRIARDIRTAVPNCIRVPAPAGSSYIEFLPTSTGGRYRAGVPGNVLDFASAVGSFDVLGQITLAANDAIIVGSTQVDGNSPYYDPDAYPASSVRRTFSGTPGSVTTVNMTPSVQFPAFAWVQGHRFAVVPGDQQAVTYSCENVGAANGEGTGTLRRYWKYGYNATLVAPGSLQNPSSAILADKVSSCQFVYATVNQRRGLVELTLGLTHGGDSISLYHEIHVSNVP